MKQKRNIFIKIASLIIMCSLLFSLASCGSDSKGSLDLNFSSKEEMAPGSDSFGDISGSVTLGNTDGKYIIKTVSISSETLAYDDAVKDLSENIESVGAYVESLTENGKSGNRSTTLTIRVPAQSLEEFCNSISKNLNITHKSVSSEDVSSKYVDIESRIETLRKEKQSLENMLAESDNYSETMQLHDRIYNLIEEIESYESQKQLYDSLISYSTVHLSLREVVVLTKPEKKGIWERISVGFKSNAKETLEDVTDFFVGFVVSIPKLVPFAIVAGTVIICVAIFIKKDKKRRIEEYERKKAEKEKSDEVSENKENKQ